MRVLFVCTGNTCRSPMAEGYLKSKNIKGLTVLSRGLCADGSIVSENSKIALAEKGIDISAHISKQIAKDDIESADKIICMSHSHKELLLPIAGEDKLSVLGRGISDPFGLDLDAYRSCRDEIVNEIDSLIFGGELCPVRVRLSVVEDIKRIAELEKICFSQPWSEGTLLESLRAGTCFITALYKGEIAGYMGISCILDEGYVTNIAVFPEFRRKGIGKAILNYCLSLGREKGLSFISLEVRESNFAAISLYEELGFETVGIRKNFYTSPIENAKIMTKRFENNENTKY